MNKRTTQTNDWKNGPIRQTFHSGRQLDEVTTNTDEWTREPFRYTIGQRSHPDMQLDKKTFWIKIRNGEISDRRLGKRFSQTMGPDHLRANDGQRLIRRAEFLNAVDNMFINVLNFCIS